MNQMTPQPQGQMSQHRLPQYAVPTFYEMRIAPDLDNATFAGDQTISLIVNEPTEVLVLNAAELVLDNITVKDDNGTELVGKASYDAENERATIRFNGTIGTGHWDLKLSFTGILNDKLRGFYLSTYKDAAGVTQRIATTKFEPTDARRAFPCWDEPAFKARYKISLVIPADMTAVSNSGLLRESATSDGRKLLEFAPTIKMSTYLVAYVVGKLEASEPVMAGTVPIRVWCVPGKKHLGAFALAAAKFSLEYFAEYFHQPYAGDKLDLVAIPDFASGAMENFACVTFRETALLLDPATASQAELERVAEVVMHENAHMWFGDFVTMSWWNGLWLNEAFATFMAALAMHAWKPEWKFWEGFNVDRAGAMRIDGLHSTRPIEFAVNKPDEARAMFDVLTYQKGCAVLRMLEQYMGEHDFRRGVAGFLDEHAFANADTPALWDALDRAATSLPGDEDVDLIALMNSWVYQPGFPLVTVTASPVTGSITLEQSPFNYDDTNTKSDKLWQIPITLRAQTAAGTVTKTFLLSQKRQTFYLGEKLGAVVVNAAGAGYFRVNYVGELKDHIVADLDHLNVSERFNFVSDMWASVLAGHASLHDYLQAVDQLALAGNETDLNVWTAITSSLHYIWRALVLSTPASEGLADKFLARVRPAMAACLDHVSWHPVSGELPQNAQLRGSLYAALGSFGDQMMHGEAKELFALYQQDRSKVETNLVTPVVNTVATSGDKVLYETFIGLRDKAATPQDERRFLFALASFRQPALVASTLERCLNGDVRTQDAPYVLQSLLMNPYAAHAAWTFFKANWSKLIAAWPSSAVVRMCEGVTALVDPALQDEVRAFFAATPVKGGDKAIAQDLELLAIACRFAATQKAMLVKELS